MKDIDIFDVIIIGGSYAGLSAGMALGRAVRKVLIIDEGKPCNRQTPHSHNFLTNDGKTPGVIAALAKQQVSLYQTVRFLNDKAIVVHKSAKGFEVEVTSGKIFQAKKLIFATGIKDLLPAIEGLTACWGISVIHCPYCHGYEVRDQETGILGNGNSGFDFTRLIANWTRDLTLFTNGISTLTAAQQDKLHQHNVSIVEQEIDAVHHQNGQLHEIRFKNGSKTSIETIYVPSPFEQHCKIPESLGCELTVEGHIAIDDFMETSVQGVYAVGDNAAKMRTVANAVSMGNAAGIMVSKKMILEEF